MGELDAATDSAHVAIYAFTSEAIDDALIEAAGRGVEVQIVADLSQSSEPNEEPVLARLQNAGLDLRLASGFNYGIMHHKFAVLDGRTVLTGSFNYTDSAKDRNDENLLVFADARLAATYETAFQELWARAEAR